MRSINMYELTNTEWNQLYSDLKQNGSKYSKKMSNKVHYYIKIVTKPNRLSDNYISMAGFEMISRDIWYFSYIS